MLFKKIIALSLILSFLSFYLSSSENYPIFQGESLLVKSSKRIYLPEFPGSHNPSILKWNDQYILTFRCQPSRSYYPWVSYIGIALLDENFKVINRPQLLNTRVFNDDISLNSNVIPSQSEDARIFTFQDKIYIVFNDNVDFENPSVFERRDMFLAEVFIKDHQFFMTDPVCLKHTEKYDQILWQKNWSPFEWQDNLLFSYSINPHEVLSLDVANGECFTIFLTQKSISWDFGSLRGGTPAQQLDNEYLAFFHSGKILSSSSTDYMDAWHYFMGAYTFSADPPFNLTSISAVPIDAEGFYTYSAYTKRVIYPGGFVIDGSNIYLAVGKDDNEVWIVTLDLNELKNSMIPVDQ